MEAAFVGNHGVWLDNGSSQGFSNASVGNLINYNAVSPATLARYGLGDLTNANTRTLLNSTITSAAAVAAGFKKPYANFPDSGSVLQSLRPFPQYSGIGQFQAPLGNSWYDSLQVKVVKRISHGLTATMAYTFGKALDSTTNAGSIYDRDSFKGLSPSYYPAHLQPQRGLHRAGHWPGQAQPHCQGDPGRLENHQPEHESERRSAWRRRPRATRSAVICPRATRRMARVPGVPLYLKDINCGCIDPTQETVLNPAAWQNQDAGRSGQQCRLLQRLPRAAPAGHFGRHRQGLQDPRGRVVQRPRGVLQPVQHDGVAGKSEHRESAESRRRGPTPDCSPAASDTSTIRGSRATA